MILVKRIILPFICTLFLFAEAMAQVIPDERIADWSKALKSYDYREPGYELNVKDFGAKGDGITDDQPAIKAAINALDGKLGFIYFPEGKYLLKNSLALTDSVVLKGDGADLSELLLDFNGVSKNGIIIQKPQPSEMIQLDEGYLKGSKVLIADSASLFSKGDDVLVYQNNGEWDDKPIGWAEHAVGQIMQIDDLSGDSIHLSSSLRIDYEETLDPRMRRIEPVVNTGIQCLKVSRLDKPESGGGANIFLRHAVNCFIRGVESDVSAGSHIDIFSSSNILVDGCYIHHAFDYDGASKHGYGITLNNQTGECLITNNIFERLRHAMMVKTGANGNVFSYNYSLDVYRSEWPNNFTGDISLHGHYPFANLFEGNIVQNIFIDHYWGPSGPLNTFFRNRAELYGIIMTAGDPTPSDGQNYVGNEITNDFFLYGQYMLTGGDHFEFGNNLLGSIIPGGTDSLPDSSYYLNQAPPFWNESLDWPSIGIPNNLDGDDIPAKLRFDAGDDLTRCPESLTTSVPGKSNNDEGFRIWPNPASDFITIAMEDGFSGEFEVILKNAEGHSMLTSRSSDEKLNMSLDLLKESGIYFISVITIKGILTKKLLVLR